MLDYIYDGTFEGLLTCVYHHYYTDKAAGIFTGDNYQPNMFNGFMKVKTEQDKAMRVYNAISEKVSAYALRMVYRAYLSAAEGKENAVLQYIQLGFRKGYMIGSLHGDPVVNRLESIVKKVSVEKERMLEFVRFEVMEIRGASAQQILYARIEPEHDVLELIAHHFADRFRNDPFIICDEGRGKAVIALGGRWYITPFQGTQLPDGSEMIRSEDEHSCQELWRTYFDHIAIKERINPRCQKNFMPQRYWKNLTEMNGKGTEDR